MQYRPLASLLIDALRVLNDIINSLQPYHHYYLLMYSLAARSSAGLSVKASLCGVYCGKTEADCTDMSGRPPIVMFCCGMSDLNCCSGDWKTS